MFVSQKKNYSVTKPGPCQQNAALSLMRPGGSVKRTLPVYNVSDSMPALILFFPWPSFFVTLFWYSKDVGRTEGVRGAFGGVLGRVQSKMSLSNALKRKRAMFLETVSRFRNIENQSRSVCHLKWNILSGWWGRRLVLSLWCQTEQPTCWVMFLILQTPTLCMTFRVRTWWTSVWISSEKKMPKNTQVTM